MAFRDRKSTRLNSSHTEIYTLSLHDAHPIYVLKAGDQISPVFESPLGLFDPEQMGPALEDRYGIPRSEEHTSELQSHRDLHSFPTRRSSDLRSESRRSNQPGVREPARAVRP